MMQNNTKNINIKSMGTKSSDVECSSNNSSNTKSSGRVMYLEYLRVLSIFFVMFHHVTRQGIEMADVPRNLHVIYTIFASWRWPIGILVMISGYLFLGRDIEIKTIYTKYLPRMVTAFFAWKLIYALYESWGNFSLFFEEFLSGPYHLWYIPMIAGLYILTPVFRQIVKDEKIMRYFLILSFIFAFVFPQIKNMINDFWVNDSSLKLILIKICSDAEDMQMNTVFGYGFYYVLGFYIGNLEINKNKELAIYACGILGNLITVFLRLKTESPVYFEFFTVNVFAMGIALFVLFMKHVHGSKRMDKLIIFFSKYSFGAYLVHILVIGIECNSFNIFVGRAHPLISVPAITVFTFLVSTGISFVLSQIPIVKKYVV